MGTTFGLGSFSYYWDGGQTIWMTTQWEGTVVLYTVQ